MKSDAELQKDVQNAFKWESLLYAAKIDIIVKNGVVSLTAIVNSYAKKIEIQNTVKKVNGVYGLIENIEVKFPNSWKKSNSEIAMKILNNLKSNWSDLKDKVTVRVENGWVKLAGELPWNYQKEAIENSVIYLMGVKGITNNIKIKAESLNTIEKKDIEEAIARSWSNNNCDIKVTVSGTTVTLTGTVRSWYQKEDINRIVWKTNGIWSLKNELIVDSYYSLVN